jgi:Flp pilus assembly protein TadD
VDLRPARPLIVSLESTQRLLDAHRPDLAEREIRLWLERHPESAAGHSLLGWALALQRKPGGVAAAATAVRLAPDSAHAHATLGELNLHWDRPWHAEKPLRRAIELAPHDPYIHANLAAALLNQRFPWRWPEGLRLAEAGLALDPHNAGCARVRAIGLMRTFRWRKARDAALYALELDPEDSDAHGIAGWTQYCAGTATEARAQLHEALRINPANSAAEQMLHQMDHYVRLSAAMVVATERSPLVMRVAAAVYTWLVVLGVAYGGPTLSVNSLAASLFFLLVVEAWTLRARITRYGRERLPELRAPGALTRGERRAMHGLFVFCMVMALLFASMSSSPEPPHDWATPSPPHPARAA